MEHSEPPDDLQDAQSESSFDGDEEFPYSFFSDKRHLPNYGTVGNTSMPITEWRIREKIKTVSVSLVLCLNIGVDPPDLVKTKPCAMMECWIDPSLLPGQKALEAIGRNLQSQYEAWQPRARYRLSLDPSIEETKKLCCSLRRSAKDERILFHYNGHGVPKPTVGGEIWVFNKSYTQYIPVSVYDIQTWLGSPCIYVYDCSNSGHILNAFNKFAAQRDSDMEALAKNPSSKPDAQGASSYTPLSHCIQLAACRADQVLPMSPDLPADLFTSCLTTPVIVALRWFVISNPLIKNVTLDMTLKVPGRVTDRRTPFGELNWIFTSITDTIAWSVLPTDLFLKLFRNDLMVAALFRNFLLADRIMRHFNCHPISSPALPQTHQHPMWEAWDLAADHCLSQLPGILETNPKVEYNLSSFFSDQLSAFEVWIKKGGSAVEPPRQLPIVLQVLLSQVHRLRALLLLSKFLDFGRWAVNLALSVGIFPYVLKLLQSPALELRPVLVFIWAKLLAVDATCRNDLLKDNGYTYFIGILTNTNSSAFMVPNISEHRAMCVFILSVFCRDFPSGQQACLANDLLPALLPYFTDHDSLLRQWACVCLGNFWTSFPDAKWGAINANAHVQLCNCLQDPVPEVRAGALAALGLLIGDLEKIEQVLAFEKTNISAMLKCLEDPSPLVRRELVCALSRLIDDQESLFLKEAHEQIEIERRPTTLERTRSSRGASGPSSVATAQTPNQKKGINQQSLLSSSWKAVLALSADPFPSVAHVATLVVDKIYQKILGSNMSDPGLEQWIDNFHAVNTVSSISSDIIVGRKFDKHSISSVSSGIFGMSIDHSSPVSTNSSFKRSSSFVFSLRNLVGMNSSFSGNTTGQGDPTLRPSRSTNAIRRRPQSMILSSSNDFWPPSRGLNTSPNEILQRAPAAPAKPSLPESMISVPSLFYDWSCEYFMEPQMKIPEIDDPGSVKFNERQWRMHRNEKLNAESNETFSIAGSLKFDALKFNLLLENDQVSPHRSLLFHAYDPYLLVTNRSEICVVNWEEQSMTHIINNCNLGDSSITCMKFLNEHDNSILLTGSTDGVVRLLKNYHDPVETTLLSSWKAESQSKASLGSLFVCEWHQNSGVLYTNGDSSVIKIWDADEEMCIYQMATDSSISCMFVDVSGNILLAGSVDGLVSIFDRRVDPEKSAINSFVSGGERILHTRFTSPDSTEFMSGSLNGDIFLWDIRNSKTPVLKVETVPGRKSHFSIHDSCQIMSCVSSATLDISLMNLSGRMLGSFKHLSSRFLNRGPSAVNGLAFHPKKAMLSTSSNSSISIF